MRIALYASATDAISKAMDVSWDDLVESLSTCERHVCNPPGRDCANKDSSAWSPIDIPDGARRNKVNVAAVTVAVFDLDHLTRDQVLATSDRLEALGLQYLVHSTHGHTTTPEDYCLRLVIPLSRPVKKSEYRYFRQVAEKHLSLSADESTKDECRLYYRPTAPEGGAQFIFSNSPGQPLNVDALLAYAPETNRPAETDVNPNPLPIDKSGSDPGLVGGNPGNHATDSRENDNRESDGISERHDGGNIPVLDEQHPGDLPRNVSGAPGGATDLQEIRKRLRKIRKEESRALIQKVLAGEALAASGARDQTLNKACSIMASAVPGMTTEVALALLTPSIAAMDCEPEGREHWLELATAKFERARERQIERRQKQDRLNEVVFGKREPKNPVQDTFPVQETTESDSWRTQLVVVQNEATGSIRLAKVPANAGLILEHDSRWAGALKFNDVTKEVELHGGPLDPAPHPATLSIEIMNWLARSEWELPLRLSEVEGQIASIARRHTYDPIKDYLAGLQWDGVARIDNWLVRFCNAQLTNAEGENIEPYVNTVGRKWLISAVARALDPGCQVDTVLILESVQGIGKTSAFRILGAQWATDSAVSVEDKDASMMAASTWIIELGELDTLRKADSSAVKSFLTRRVERFRPPYGRVIENMPRRCVFVGSTNKDEYLTDPTGNRRYWPIACSDADIERDALSKARDQLWAEAVVAYKKGEAWWFDRSAAAMVEAQTDARMQSSTARADRIITWFTKLPLSQRPKVLTTYAVLTGAFGVSDSQLTRALEMEVGQALRDLGFVKKKAWISGQARWGYHTPESLLESPQVFNMPNHALVAHAKGRTNDG